MGRKLRYCKLKLRTEKTWHEYVLHSLKYTKNVASWRSVFESKQLLSSSATGISPHQGGEKKKKKKDTSHSNRKWGSKLWNQQLNIWDWGGRRSITIGIPKSDFLKCIHNSTRQPPRHVTPSRGTGSAASGCFLHQSLENKARLKGCNICTYLCLPWFCMTKLQLK